MFLDIHQNSFGVHIRADSVDFEVQSEARISSEMQLNSEDVVAPRSKSSRIPFPSLVHSLGFGQIGRLKLTGKSVGGTPGAVDRVVRAIDRLGHVGLISADRPGPISR